MRLPIDNQFKFGILKSTSNFVNFKSSMYKVLNLVKWFSSDPKYVIGLLVIFNEDNSLLSSSPSIVPILLHDKVRFYRFYKF